MLERLNEEIKRRTHVVRIFPNAESCLRLVRALAVEAHENWLEANRYLNMDDLREQKKLQLRQAA
jgi:putative transposase